MIEVVNWLGFWNPSLLQSLRKTIQNIPLNQDGAIQPDIQEQSIPSGGFRGESDYL